jgi:hypothetical protein
MPKLAIKTVDIADLLRQAAARAQAAEEESQAGTPPPNQPEPSPAVEEYPIGSRAIEHISYDPEDSSALVRFVDGTQYILSGFPRSELNRWLRSKSMGRYWNYNIRGRY